MADEMLRTSVQVTPEKAAEMKVEQIKDPELVKTVVLVSPKGVLGEKDWKNIRKNFIKFGAPALSVFFAQLAIGVDWKAAALVAVYVLYQLLADYFGKLKDGPEEK